MLPVVSLRALAVMAFSVSLVAGCSGPIASGGDDAASEDPLISDADSLTRRSDGQFDVRCRDGRTEIATATQIQSNEICKPQISTDPFDISCSGTPLDAAAAGAYFKAGAISTPTFGSVHVYGRVRSCNRTTGCGAWQRDDTILEDDGGSSSGALRPLSSGTLSFGIESNVSTDAIRYVLYTNATSLRCTLAGNCTAWNNLYIHRDGKFWESTTLNWSHSNFSVKPGAGCLSGTILATNSLDSQRYDEAQARVYATFSAPH